MRYNIISTGSKGNAVVLENSIMVDCGVPFKALKDVYRDLKLVLLTHIHSDHFNKRTIARLAKERPTLMFGCCEWLVAPLVECGVEKWNIEVYEFGQTREYRDIFFNPYGWFPDFAVHPFALDHDVPNCGYKIFIGKNGAPIGNVLYATDTSRINVEAKDFDLYLVEANYDDEEVQERIEKQIIGGADYIHEYKAMKNHLSEKDAMDFIVKNAGPKSEYLLLHKHEDRKDG